MVNEEVIENFTSSGITPYTKRNNLVDKLVVGVPSGSLNDPRRGSTKDRFARCFFYLGNYEIDSSSKPVSVNDRDIHPILIRPQLAFPYLRDGHLDAAIVGDDWYHEWIARDPSIGRDELVKKICDLNFGGVNLVPATKRFVPGNTMDEFLEFMIQEGVEELVGSSEYPGLAVELLMHHILKNDKFKEYFGEERPTFKFASGDKYKGNPKLRIEESCGATEAQVGFTSHWILEVTQQGNSFASHYLKPLESEFSINSSAGFYASKIALGIPHKQKKIYYFRDMLERFGDDVVNPKDFIDLEFDAKGTENLENVLRVCDGVNDVCVSDDRLELTTKARYVWPIAKILKDHNVGLNELRIKCKQGVKLCGFGIYRRRSL